MSQPKDSAQHFEALLQLGRSQCGLGQWRSAHKSFQKILKQAPDHREANLELAKLYIIQKKSSKARTLLQDLLEEALPPLEAILIWAQSFGQTHAQATLKHLEKALNQHPNHAELLIQTAEYLIQNDQPERAYFHLQHCLENPLHSGRIWLALAHLLLQIGELSQASEAFQRAAEREPKLRQDPDWIDVEANWKSMQANMQPLDLASITEKLQTED